MAKHFYHIPLQKALLFIKEHKSLLNALTTEKKMREYYKQLGKSYYLLQIEIFMDFFKISKEINYTLKTLSYFNSTLFMDELCKILNFSQFEPSKRQAYEKDLFYALCYVYVKRDPEAFEHFMQKTFLHYHTAFNTESQIRIDHQEMSHTLAKSKKLKIRESFGDNDEEAFFKLFLDDTLTVEEKGRRIKTLRKKAYKRLFYKLIAWEEHMGTDEREKTYEMMHDMSML